MSKKELLVLVDGSAVFYRGYYAIPHLSNREGLPTNAVYGFTTIFLKMLQDLNPKYVVVAWDKSGKTFRHDMYSEYKGTRKATPEDLIAQIPTLKELVAALKLPFVELEGFEADDIIGTLACEAEKRGDLDTIVVTGDLDELQLVDRNTVVRIAKTNGESKDYDLTAVQERYGVTPKQFIDVKALKGDASDNIPGVPGIGEKGAMDLIAKYGSLDAVYEHLDELTTGLQKKLTEGKELAYLSQKLSTIVLDVPVKLDLEASRIGAHDVGEVHDLFRRLDFRSLLPKLPEQFGSGPEVVNVSANQSLFDEGGSAPVRERTHLKSAKYTAITTKSELELLVARLEKQSVFALDTETDSLDILTVNLVGVSVAFKAGEAYYIPVGHTEGTQLTCEYVTNALKPVLENPKIGKIGHNIKYDYEVLKRYNITTTPVAMDTMVASFILNPLGRAPSLDELVYNELGIEMIPISDLIGSGKDQITFDKTLIEPATTYAAEDADMAWRLYERLAPRMTQQRLDKLGNATEWPLIPILGDMEIKGIELDVKTLKAFGDRLVPRIAALKEDIYREAGEEFNLNSPSQLAQILYERLKLSTVGVKKGKTGFSTAIGELERLKGAHPIIPLIMEFRELDKLMNTYVLALPETVRDDGRVHTSFSQVIAQTGRLSSNNPNLMQIPVRTETGREIREAFVAPKGRVLVSADYSQIELRVAAALAHDDGMIETFKNGIDLHQQTAAELYSVSLDQVTKEQRSASKTINFGVLYGMSPHGLSVATGMDGKEAADFIMRYFEVRPALAKYIADTKKFAYDEQYTETLFGRRRPCPEIRSSNFQIRSSAERVAVNVPIQGTAADIYKLAMIALAAKLDDDCDLLLQIHDELIVEAPAAKGEAVAALMKEVMENVYDLGVPLAVDTAVGTNWGQL